MTARALLLGALLALPLAAQAEAGTYLVVAGIRNGDIIGTRCSTASIDNVAQTVEESSAFAQGKKLVERHPFLTGLLGPSIVRTVMNKAQRGSRACSDCSR